MRLFSESTHVKHREAQRSHAPHSGVHYATLVAHNQWSARAKDANVMRIRARCYLLPSKAWHGAKERGPLYAWRVLYTRWCFRSHAAMYK